MPDCAPSPAPTQHPQAAPLGSRLSRSSLSFLSLIAFATALTIVPAQAAGPGATHNAPALSAPGTSYLVKKNDTLDKLLVSHYKASPLKPEVLRSAVLAANPALGNGKTARLKPGSTLLLPDHGHIALGTLMPLVSEQALASLAPSPAPDPTARRDWVRYP